MAGASEPDGLVSVSLYLDGSSEPIAVHRPPAHVSLDTSGMEDGEHVLHLRAVDSVGNVGVRDIPFTVANGPGITVTGLRAGSRVRGQLELSVNAFGADEPFDPVRAESEGPVPVWTWVFFAIVIAWAAWYGLEYFATPAAFAKTPTYAANPLLAQASAPGVQSASSTATASSTKVGNGNVAGFDFTTLGPQVYAQNCQACHGATGTGVPGAFPALAGNAVVNGPAEAHITIVLHGLSGKAIDGTHYSAQMPAFAGQLTDAQIAAVIDHERTSWGNHGATITPSDVKKLR